MRTSYSIKNSITSIVGNSISFIIAFISQAIFIRILGAEYLGLNGLFTNILSMLSIFELGIGNAIVFHLYKPIAEHDEYKISSLMNFYKKAYNIISLLILTFGLLLIPFLKYFTKDVTIDVNIYIVFVLFLLSTITSYLLAYKRNLIIANQKNYIINIIHTFYLIILNVCQLSIIYFSKNYYAYLIVKIICQVAENIIISIISDRKYQSILQNKNAKLDTKTEKDIFDKVKALFFHQIGSIVVLSTDNIIISSFFGIVSVGLYSNYNTIINGVTTVFGQIINSTTASVGNLMLLKDENKKFEIFKKIRFLNFLISTFTSICILNIVQPFIVIWVGKKYLLSIEVVIVIVFNYFQSLQRQTYSTFKNSSGIWTEDKYVPLIESVLNIVFSIIFLKLFGLIGVFLGTFVSGLALWCYSYPKFVYKNLFNKSYVDYARETLGYVLLFVVLATGTYCISNIFIFDNIWYQLMINIIISLIFPNIILVLIFRKSDEFKYFYNLFKKVVLKKKSMVNSRTSDKKLDGNANLDVTSVSSNEEIPVLPSNSINEKEFILPKEDIIPKEEIYTDRESLSNAIRNDNSYIKNIDFNYHYNFDIIDLILEEIKIYNYKFNNEDYLRDGKYPIILSNNHSFMKYVIDKDFNNIFYVDSFNMDKNEINGIINYTFKKVYFLKEKDKNITFNCDKFKDSNMMSNSYFIECLKYIK